MLYLDDRVLFDIFYFDLSLPEFPAYLTSWKTFVWFPIVYMFILRGLLIKVLDISILSVNIADIVQGLRSLMLDVLDVQIFIYIYVLFSSITVSWQLFNKGKKLLIKIAQKYTVQKRFKTNVIGLAMNRFIKKHNCL